MKGNLVWVLTGLITLSMPLCVEALAAVESRTGSSAVYSEQPIARSPVSSASSASAEDRAALFSLKQLEALKQEISELRGLVETQAHEIHQLKKSQQDFYTDLDKRINQLPSVKGTSSVGAAAKTAAKTLVVVGGDRRVGPTTKGKSSITIVPTATASSVRTAVSPAVILAEESEESEKPEEVAVKTDEPIAPELSNATLVINKKNETNHLTEKAAYEAAYNLVRTKQYSEATSAFQNYLTQFKDGEHAAKAHYWMGEICMVQWQKDPKNKALLDKAAHAFSNIALQFPGNPKVPDALLKLGIVENEKGNLPAARKYFTDVKNRYPGSAAARIAETRLRGFEGGKSEQGQG